MFQLEPRLHVDKMAPSRRMTAKAPMLFIGLGGSGARVVGACKRLSAFLPATPHLLAIDREWLQLEAATELQSTETIALRDGKAGAPVYLDTHWLQDNCHELNVRLNEVFSELRQTQFVSTEKVRPKIIIVGSEVGRTGQLLLPLVTQAVRSSFSLDSVCVAAWLLGPAIFAALNPYGTEPSGFESALREFDFRPADFDEVVLFDTDTVERVRPGSDVMQFIGHELSRELPSIRSVNRLYVSRDKNPASTVEHLSRVNAGLIESLSNRPHLLNQLEPRAFEEVVAELWGRMGYSVTLTPRSRDGGKDIYALHHSEVGDILYVIECKKYSPDRPVGVEIVRSLYGVAQQERATMGIVATTSTFTKGAKEFQSKVPHQLSLHDYEMLANWLVKASATR